MVFHFPSEPASGSGADFASLLGWPLGLRSGVLMEVARPAEAVRPGVETAELQAENMPNNFLLPYISASASSDSDSDTYSEAASSFFKDSRRITLGSLIGLPLDSSGRAGIMRAEMNQYQALGHRRTRSLGSCGLWDILGCARGARVAAEANRDEDGDPSSSYSLAEQLELERSAVTEPTAASDKGLVSVMYEESLSAGSRSPEWNPQFVSANSTISDADSMEDQPFETDVLGTPSNGYGNSTERVHVTARMQRSFSMRSFFSTICCRLDAQTPVE